MVIIIIIGVGVIMIVIIMTIIIIMVMIILIIMIVVTLKDDEWCTSDCISDTDMEISFSMMSAFSVIVSLLL